jgi:hypothetical protein
MTRPLHAIAIFFCIFLFGCSEAGLVHRFTPPEEESIARNDIDLLIQGKFPEIESRSDSAIVGPDAEGRLANMSAMFPGGSPRSAKVVGVEVYKGERSSRTNLTFEYEYPSKWLLVNIDLQKKGTATTIAWLHVEPMPESLESANRFTLVGKSAAQYSILFAAVALFLFSLYVLVLCVRARNVRRKWLWIIFILVGVGKQTVNWTSGELRFTPLAMSIPCASATAPPYGPWTVGVYLPLGAILFLRERRKKLNQDLTVPSPPPAPSDTST